jgi:hypothetical protein
MMHTLQYTDCSKLHSAAVDLNPPLNQYYTGYGTKISTRYKVKYGDTPRELAAWRRVYATCFSNVASVWIDFHGEKLYLDSGIEYFLTDGIADERMAMMK